MGHGGKNLFQIYRFHQGISRDKIHRIILGSFTLQKRFSTDNRFWRFIRGGIAIICLLSMSLVGFYALIAQPSRLGLLNGDPEVLPRPITLLKVPATSEKLLTYKHEVRIALDVGEAVANPSIFSGHAEDLGSYVKTAVALPYDLQPSLNHSTIRNCISSIQEQLNSPRKWYLTVDCGIADIWTDPGAAGIDADILVSLDFFGNFTQSNQHKPSLSLPVAVYISLTDSWDDVIAHTRPVYLLPGDHIRAMSSYWVKEKFVNNALAAMGISRLTIPIPPVDPSLSGSTATLRVTLPSYHNSSYLVPEILIERDYYQDTMLTGFALLGGIWTFINGLFAAIFGSTLLLVLFGIKPLSIYGLVHFFQRQEEALVTRNYKSTPEEQIQVVGLLRDHLLDVKQFNTEEGNEPVSGRIPGPSVDMHPVPSIQDPSSSSESEHLMEKNTPKSPRP
ncbi:hypothetical protein NP233_g12350 [Leucocoprinus birnbaumii]|uniref:Uncharacterized protein n=1 Tax=Leucocoprinus birnbaumii TaxID=56174 RepID=A0AAD5VGG5_9AGAR|nr:hypothetical protein NP233_g12350 [Leucocoprinus birnbaumii]